MRISNLVRGIENVAIGATRAVARTASKATHGVRTEYRAAQLASAQRLVEDQYRRMPMSGIDAAQAEVLTRAEVLNAERQAKIFAKIDRLRAKL